jgi:hypothetical protein
MERRLKKILITISLFIIGLLVFAAPCSIYTSIDRTNAFIAATIERSVETADRLVTAEVSPEIIIDNLIRITDSHAGTMADRAARRGVSVVNEYDPVLIGGQIALVDPCRVLND